MVHLRLFVIIITLLLSVSSSVFSQQGIAINKTGSPADSSAGLDVNFTDKGFLLPRMTENERDSIAVKCSCIPAEGLMIFNSTSKCLEMFVGGAWNTISCPLACNSPSSPAEGAHTPAVTQIVWNWNASVAATGYKWNTVNDIGTATDMGTSTNKTETALACNTAYTRYVWAYNSCGASPVTVLSSTTSACCTDGTGGIITHVGGYTIHTFTSSGTFVPSCTGNVEILVVAGGGGGGAGWEGCGGGGGGVCYDSAFYVTPGSYSITVGNGGAGGCCGTNVSDHSGAAGQNSSFNGTIIAYGGGGGGNFPPDAGDPLKTNASTGKPGGSGGGGLRNYPGGAATQTDNGGAIGYGNAGGGASIYQASAGGGGAGAPGQTPTAYECGSNGGDGISFGISGTPTYYGGGGGAGGSVSCGTGGAGGGGNGAYNDAQDGTPNTGGGGGGARVQGNVGGDGGSGVVIIRYLTP